MASGFTQTGLAKTMDVIPGYYKPRDQKGFYMVHPVGASNTKLPVNFQLGKYNTAAMCKEMFRDLATIGERACGKEYATHSTGSGLRRGLFNAYQHKAPPVEKTAVLDCGTGAAAVSAGFAILYTCAKS